MTPKEKNSVLIVDDFPIVRTGLRTLIDGQPDMFVVAEAGNGVEAIALVEEHSPEIVIMDLRMPQMNGLEATRKICSCRPEKCQIIVLTGSSGYEAVYQALDAGAKAYLLKTAQPVEILKAVRTVAAGKRYLPPSIRERLSERIEADVLTRRELQILELIIHGFSNVDIAAELGVVEGTVKGHVNRLLSKMGVADRTQAALTAIDRGLFLWAEESTRRASSAKE